jgi:hypothetical protein
MRVSASPSKNNESLFLDIKQYASFKIQNSRFGCSVLNLEFLIAKE